mgnify:FL=1
MGDWLNTEHIMSKLCFSVHGWWLIRDGGRQRKEAEYCNHD